MRRVAVALALVLGACGGAGPSVAPAPDTTTTLAPAVTTTASAPSTTTTSVAPGIQQRAVVAPGSLMALRFDDAMAPDALATVEETLPVARQDFGDSGTLIVHVYAGADAFVGAHDARSQQRARDDIASGPVASSSSGAIWIYGPRYLERDRTTRRLIVLHEYFHTAQYFLSGGRSSRAPIWLTEGSARYFEARAGADHGYTDFNRRRDADVRLSRSLQPLQAYEASGGRTDGGDAYTLGFVATDYLVNTKGIDALKRDVWAQLRTAPDWPAAFAAVFGMPLDQFYADFEAYRATL